MRLSRNEVSALSLTRVIVIKMVTAEPRRHVPFPQTTPSSIFYVIVVVVMVGCAFSFVIF
jgi:hypothetical protein